MILCLFTAIGFPAGGSGR